MRKYRGCRHEFEWDGDTYKPFLMCPKCRLEVHVFPSHISLGIFTEEGRMISLGFLSVPDPEDEEATELEPEEVTADAGRGTE